VDLTAVAESVADAYQPDAEDAGHHISTELAPNICVHGDQELLTQGVANLVENALHHTPSGARISVRLYRNGPGASMNVEDDGPGVGVEDLPRLTHRFYRGERSRTTPGNGLGLSLVAAVADLHGAKLHIENAGPGLRASTLFPVSGETK
jgi:signal transduction histidine kinase